MEVILLERVGRLGNIGDVVKVKDGFGRNFLIPQKKALRATDENKKVFEAKRSTIDAENAKLRKEAEAQAAKMDKLSVVLVRQASEDGKLYGSVTTRDIVEQLNEKGIKVDRKHIDLTATIKSTGHYTAKLALHPEVVLTLPVQVVRNESDIETAVAPELLADSVQNEQLETDSSESQA